MTLEEQIQKETELIKKLESSFPKFYNEPGQDRGIYNEKNTPYWQHDTVLRDAYWRR